MNPLKGKGLEWWSGLPNKLSLGRLAAIPLLMILYPWDVFWLNVLCAFIFLAAALTDFLDGYIARTYREVTQLGGLLDHVADKLLIACSLVLLVGSGAMPAFIASLLIARELAVSGLRLLAAERGITLNVNQFGKSKTVVQCLAVFCLFINRTWIELPFRTVGMLAAWVAVGLSIYSAYTYWLAFWPQFQSQHENN